MISLRRSVRSGAGYSKMAVPFERTVLMQPPPICRKPAEEYVSSYCTGTWNLLWVSSTQLDGHVHSPKVVINQSRNDNTAGVGVAK